MIGTIKTINEKGFGFITVAGNPKGVFFHASNCKGAFEEMREGDKVFFNEIIKTEKGLQADEVSLTS